MIIFLIILSITWKRNIVPNEPESISGVEEWIEVSKMVAENDPLLTLTIALESEDKDIIIHKDPWMLDWNVYGNELSTLKKSHKEKSEIQKKGFQLITESLDLKAEFIAYVENDIDEYEKYKKEQISYQNYLNKLLSFLTTRPGRDLVHDEKIILESDLKKLQENMELSLMNIEDRFFLIDALIRTKQQIIPAVEIGQVDRAPMLANDEDTIGLVLSWYEEGDLELGEERQRLIKEFGLDNNLK